jgi:hypothetical protein
MKNFNIPIFRLKFDIKSKLKFLKGAWDILSSDRPLGESKYTKEFEDRFAKMSDSKFALACSNGTTAIELALKSIDVKGKKVLIPSNTFFATSVAVTNAGGIIELLDMEPDSFSIDVKDLETKQRELAARDNCAAYFKRIHDRADDLQHLTFEELIDKGIDKYVFRLGDGTRTKNLAQTFEILMKDSDLLLDRRSNSNRTLYSLRHTYATFALLYEKLDLFDLEKQMGTSAEMIRKHYAHITTRMIAGRLAGTDYEKIKREREEGIKLLNEAEAAEADATNVL